MSEQLIIENFGPIKKAKIDVNDMMIFIGAQSSGKSTLAKIITILNDFNFRQTPSLSIIEELKKYNLLSFLKSTTIIKYESRFFTFDYSNGKEEKFDYNRFLHLRLKNNDNSKSELDGIRFILGIMIDLIVSDGKADLLLREIQQDSNYGLSTNLSKIINQTINQVEDYSATADNVLKLYDKKLTSKEYKHLATTVGLVFSFIRPLDSLYIPAERTLLPLVVNSIAGLINNKVEFPQYVLQAVQEFEKALNNIDNFDLDVIGDLRFKRISNKSYIYHNKNQKVLLREASSGVQSILPILLLIESSIKKENYINLNYVVEEPELNLYPEAQYNLTKYLVKSCLETDQKVQSKNLILTTHSPYILASINNLLLAHKKGDINSEKASKIVKKESWINPEKFNAYEVINGKVKRIFNKKSKLIDDNIINDVSEIIMQDFKSLAIIND